MKKFLLLIFCLYIVFGNIVCTYAKDNIKVALTEKELEYISLRDPVKVVVDPDWYPYEKIDKNGLYKGISADIIELISERTGLDFKVIKTSSWSESINLSKSGQADVVSCLNQTEERSRWLLFTEPYFVDPNVFITREEHDYISNLSRLSNETMVLPEGTSIEERLRKDYPNLKIITVESEQMAIDYVENKKANMTLRSLTMAAYVIKNSGKFNLKISGEIPNYSNEFRIGITKQDTMLQGILNKGIASITDEDIQNVINKHISIKVVKGFDYKSFGIIFVIFLAILLSSLFWIRRIQKLNNTLKDKNNELIIFSEKLTSSEEKYKKIAEEMKIKNKMLEKASLTDVLTGLGNRNYFNQRILEEFKIANLYNSPLSLLIIDMDHFKRINDTYGHDAGDDVIRKLSETLKSMIMKIGILSRWGGEEFVILLPGMDLNSALDIAENLRAKMESIVHLNNEVVTVSIGVSMLMESDTIESLFRRTDRSLYHAKQQGRNRVCASKVFESLDNDNISWNPNWESGHLGIDKQHKELITACNDLINKSLHKDIKYLMQPELEIVIKLIKEHFEYEEEVLIQMNYYRLDDHMQKHQELLEKAEQLSIMSSAGNLLPSDVIHFVVEDVVKNHLIQEDMKFFNLL